MALYNSTQLNMPHTVGESNATHCSMLKWNAETRKQIRLPCGGPFELQCRQEATECDQTMHAAFDWWPVC